MAFYYHEQIRKYVSAFGKLFANLDVQRADDQGNILETERCPLKYSPKSSFVYRANQDAELDRKPAIKLPHMGFDLESIERDPSRARAATRKMKITNENGEGFVYVPSPVIMTFNLTIAAKTQTEMFQLVEQIIPLFDPDLTLSINVIGADQSFNVPIIIQSNSYDDTYEQQLGERRSLTWSLTFQMYGYIFGSATKQGLIREVLTETYVEGATPGTSIKIQPTLGDGTPIDEIQPDDNWTVDESITWTDA